MATDIVQGLFGMTPESYQMQQQAAARQQAAQFAQMDPFQQANYGLYYGANQVGGGIGGMLGAQDPMLQRISQQQSLLQEINPSDAASLAAGIKKASEMGNPQLALSLSDTLRNLQKTQAESYKAYKEALTPEQRNAQALAAMEAAPGTPEFAAALKKQMERLTTKTPSESLLKAQAIVDARTAVRNTKEGTPERAAAEDMLRALQMDKYDITELGVQGNPELVQKFFIDKFDPTAKPIPAGAPYSRATARISATATTGENQYGSTIGGGIAKDDLALRAAANGAQDLLNNAATTEKLLQSGNIITGAGANAKLNVLAFGQALGATGKTTDELIANTQQLQQQRSIAVLQQIKSSGLGTGQGFTDKDLKFLQDSAAGSITLSAETLRRQIEAERNAARALAAKWNKRLGELPQAVVGPMGLVPVQLTANTSFATVQEAMAAKLPKGTQITVGGRPAVVE
jgi:hypothetical protein